jgi:hypothetical protein
MTSLPRVDQQTRQRVSREFDDLGPEACLAEISEELRAHNPEFLNMAVKSANDVGDPGRMILGVSMFYRLLLAEAEALHEIAEPQSEHRLSPLPRVSPDTRDALVRAIDASGPDAFTVASLAELERDNPELLQMAHNFASSHSNYLGVMQAFALLYASLAAQARADRTSIQ